MLKISVIGSDSFIASCFYNSFDNKEKLKLFSRKSSGKRGEIIIEDLLQISDKNLEGIDVVINFAAIVHQPGLKNSILYNNVNTKLPIQIAIQAKKAGVRHFVQMSSIAVYGNASKININTPEFPVNMYGESKFNADKALLCMHDKNFKVTVVRPPMVYGGGLAPGNMLKLIKFAQSGLPLPFKRVKNERDFIHVLNLVKSLKIIIENELTGIVFPTDKNPVSTESIVEIIKKYSSKTVRQMALPQILLNIIEKLIPLTYEKLFGNLKIECNLPEEIYKPTHSIEFGIKEMVEIMKEV